MNGGSAACRVVQRLEAGQPLISKAAGCLNFGLSSGRVGSLRRRTAVPRGSLPTRASGGEDAPWAAAGYKGAKVSQLPVAGQIASVAAIFAGIGIGTAASCTIIGPAVADAAPGFFAFSKATWPLLGVTYLAAGVAHFTQVQGFLDM